MGWLVVGTTLHTENYRERERERERKRKLQPPSIEGSSPLFIKLNFKFMPTNYLYIDNRRYAYVYLSITYSRSMYHGKMLPKSINEYNLPIKFTTWLPIYR